MSYFIGSLLLELLLIEWWERVALPPHTSLVRGAVGDAVDVANGTGATNLDAADAEDAGNVEGDWTALPDRQEAVHHRHVQLEHARVLAVRDHASLVAAAR